MSDRSVEVTVGNAASPHFRKVWPLDPEPGATTIHVESHPQGKGAVLETLRQIAVARRVTRQARRDGVPVVVRAHGAGRAGLIARLLIDKHPFVIVYGSEVVEAPARSRLSRELTTRTVRDASGLAVASKSMVQPIDELVPGAGAKVRIVAMPVAWDRFAVATARQGDRSNARVLSVRRMLPLYRIVEIVQAHAALGRGSLALLQGAVPDDEPYVATVQRAVEHHGGDVEVLRDFFDVDGLVTQYSQTDIAVSIPEHDQMSVGMLEALGAGCVAVVSDLRSYEFLKGLDHIIWVSDAAEPDEIREALDQALRCVAAGPTDADRQQRATAVREAYEEAFPPVA